MARIAATWLGTVATVTHLGGVRLRPHQIEAASRLRVAMAQWGGALLADEVGLGKTYVALAIARDAQLPLIAAPAMLREMWHSAMDRASVICRFVSYEALSRGNVPAIEPDLIVLDEAHHARNPSTRRHREICSLAGRARVLLLTATPLHNAASDLDALLSIFVGQRAGSLSSESRASLIVRRSHADVGPDVHVPRAGVAVPIARRDSGWLLDAIMSLPPPIPPSDGGDGGALLALGLIRRWSSSRAALRSSLRHRLAMGTALVDALTASRHVTRAELSAWTYADSALQLAFPELVTIDSAADNVTSLHESATRHVAAVRALLDRMNEDAHAGEDRRISARLLELRRSHAGERIVAFSQFTDTILELWQHMRVVPRIGMITGSRSAIASGRIHRSELLANFSPGGSARPRTSAAEGVELLLATDLLSEGIDLRDASVVVHLDLPWTAARLDQRVGRSRRLGGSHERTSVYTFLPPASAERIIRIERRLARKARLPRSILGATGSPLHDDVGHTGEQRRSEVRCAAHLGNELSKWPSSHSGSDGPRSTPYPGVLIATAMASNSGWIASVPMQQGGSVLLASLNHCVATRTRVPRDDPCTLLRAVRSVQGVARNFTGDEEHPRGVESIVDAIQRWRARRDVSQPTMLGSVARATLELLTRRAHEEPASKRAAIAAISSRIRRRLSAPLPSSMERDLRALLAAPPAKGAAPLVAALTTILRLEAPIDDRVEPLAILILVPAPPQG